MKFNWAFGKIAPKRVKQKPTLRKVGIEIAKLTGLAIVLSPANFLLTNFLLFHPDRQTQANPEKMDALRKKYNMTWTDETFKTKDGTKLHGWYLKLADSKKTFLVSHGNGGNLAYRLKIIDALASSGSSVFVYDYRGYGKSEGQPTPEGIAEDGIGAYDFLVKEKHIEPENIVLYGESLGCAVSTYISENRPVCGIVLQSGFSTIVAAARDRLPWFKLYPEESFPQRFLDNVTAYKRAHPPLLLVHGEKDWVLPSRYSQEIFDNACEPKQFVRLPNSAHNDVYGPDAKIAEAALNNFVASLISQTVAHNKPAEQQITPTVGACIPAIHD
jgi:pimeloyl-ACP methyl ester carboxylesterase